MSNWSNALFGDPSAAGGRSSRNAAAAATTEPQLMGGTPLAAHATAAADDSSGGAAGLHLLKEESCLNELDELAIGAAATASEHAPAARHTASGYRDHFGELAVPPLPNALASASASAELLPVGLTVSEPTEHSYNDSNYSEASQPPPRIYKPCVVCSDRSSGCAPFRSSWQHFPYDTI